MKNLLFVFEVVRMFPILGPFTLTTRSAAPPQKR